MHQQMHMLFLELL